MDVTERNNPEGELNPYNLLMEQMGFFSFEYNFKEEIEKISYISLFHSL